MSNETDLEEAQKDYNNDCDRSFQKVKEHIIPINEEERERLINTSFSDSQGCY